MDSTLHALLDQGLALSPEYAQGMSSHLPMALHALQGLGAPPERLREFHARYARRLAPRPAPADDADVATNDPTAADWRQHRGRLDRFEALHRHFQRAVQRDGLAATLAEALPQLLPGVAGAAFHGLIRCAHGVAAGHAGEAAMGLAYWAARYLPLGGAAPATAGTRALPDWLDGVVALRRQGPVSGPMISGRMAAWAALPDFAPAAGALRVDAGTLDALATEAAALHARSGDFTVLHLVTASQALRTLRPWLGDELAAVRWFAPAAAAGVLASGVDPHSLGEAPAPRPWPDLVAAAVASNDDHVIKLVHATRALAAGLGDDPVFRQSATRAVQGR